MANWSDHDEDNPQEDRGRAVDGRELLLAILVVLTVLAVVVTIGVAIGTFVPDVH